jgi:hypothetical protein
MSIEEKAKEYESNIGSQDYVPTEIEEAFIAGSEWMQSELIEKAVEWFKHQKEEIGISWFDDFEIRFRKAMKNQFSSRR